MLTRDLINNLCVKLDHEDKSPLIVKKLVTENWLEKVDDLRYVPKSRLEHWQVPLRLVDEIFDYIVETEADALTHGVSHWLNYSFRPTVDQYVKGPVWSTMEYLRKDAEKRRDPEAWAKKVLEGWVRRLKQRRRQEYEQRLLAEALMESNSKEDFCRLSEKDHENRRRKRAYARIGAAVKVWREKRKAQKGRGKGSERTSLVKQDPRKGSGGHSTADQREHAVARPSGLGCLLVRHSEGKPKDCEVSRLLLATLQAAHHADQDCQDYVHRLVTMNWIEQLEDLELVEDRHWESWAFPEKIVILLKQELREHQESNSTKFQEVAVSVGNGAANGACEVVSCVTNWIYGNNDEDDRKDSLKRGSISSDEPSGRTRRI